VDQVAELPAVGPGARPQLVLGFGKGDVEAPLAQPGALDQELQRDRGLAGAGAAFEEVNMPRSKPAEEDVVQPRYADRGLPRH
jgi:hypothetical protein